MSYHGVSAQQLVEASRDGFGLGPEGEPDPWLGLWFRRLERSFPLVPGRHVLSPMACCLFGRPPSEGGGTDSSCR